MIGLIPLSETVHELVHTQYLFVPTDKVYGYYKQFVNTYYNYIDPEILDKLDELEKLTIEGKYNDMYKQVLEKKLITVDMEGNNQYEQLHELQDMLRERLQYIKNGEDSKSDFSNSPIMHKENL